MKLNIGHVTISPRIDVLGDSKKTKVLSFELLVGTVKVGELYYDPYGYPDTPWRGHAERFGNPAIQPQEHPGPAINGICALYSEERRR